MIELAANPAAQHVITPHAGSRERRLLRTEIFALLRVASVLTLLAASAGVSAAPSTTAQASQQHTATPATVDPAEQERINRINRMLMEIIENFEASPPVAAPPSAANSSPEVIGNWMTVQSLSLTGGSFPNWADGSTLALPRFTDPNPPRVSLFQIRQNGTYTFLFGQDGVVYTSHHGRFTVSPATGDASRRYPLLITFTPDQSSYRAFRSLEAMPEPLRGMGAGERTYRVRVVGDELRFIGASEPGWLQDIGMFRLFPAR
jgi:hypothetical protein